MKHIVLLSLICCSIYAEQNIVTYPLWKGRFGENILSFTYAKWFAYKHDLKLHYTPFEYSDELALHDLEERRNESDSKRIPMPFSNPISMTVLKNQGLMYQADFFTNETTSWTYDGLLIENDPVFRRELQRVLAPRTELPKINIPENNISVAVHIRRGGGFDRPLSFEAKEKSVARACYEDSRFPLKFPKDEFYIEQIMFVANYFKGQKLYIHLFTDDKNPKAIVDQYAAALNNPNITFGYRESGNAHDAHVVEDFFAMTQFDCLIRADSSFSKATQLIKEYKILIYPRGVCFTINDVGIEIRN